MFKKITLKNGLTIITSPMKNTRSVTVLILVKAGTKYETKQKNGISHFLEHMYFKGTKKRPKALDITKEIDGVGGTLNAFTSKDFTGYFVKVDYTHLNLALDIVSDIFLNSTLPEEEIERERGVIVEEIKMIEDTPREYIEDVWEKTLYEDQPAGWNIAGTKETVLKIKREDFLEYIKNYYVSSSTVVGVAGRIDDKKMILMIKNYFDNVPKRKSRKKKKVKDIQLVPKKLFYKKATQQTHLAVGVRAFNLFDEKKFPTLIMAAMLGGNMSSYLFQELREKRGLAYYVATHPESNPDTGYLVSYTGINHKNIENVVSLILEEYKKFKNNLPKEGDFQRAKEYIKGKLRLSLEESENVASFYTSQALFEKKILTPEEKLKKIDKVKREDITEVAREIFRKENLNLASISPKERKIEKFTI